VRMPALQFARHSFQLRREHPRGAGDLKGRQHQHSLSSRAYHVASRATALTARPYAGMLAILSVAVTLSACGSSQSREAVTAPLAPTSGANCLNFSAWGPTREPYQACASHPEVKRWATGYIECLKQPAASTDSVKNCMTGIRAYLSYNSNWFNASDDDVRKLESLIVVEAQFLIGRPPTRSARQLYAGGFGKDALPPSTLLPPGATATTTALSPPTTTGSAPATAAPYPLKLSLAVKEAYAPQAVRVVTTCKVSPSQSDLYALVTVATDTGMRSQVAFQFISTAGWFAMWKDSRALPPATLSGVGPIVERLKSKCGAAASRQSPSRTRNLTATPAVKLALRSAFLSAHPSISPSKIDGPIQGKTYYGSDESTSYALAVFSTVPLGTQDQPEVFRKPTGKDWIDEGDTGGCLGKIPKALLSVWRLTATC
jgi:hypothetical protein